MTVYADLFSFEEDERIGLIGDIATRQQRIVGFFIDADPAKIDRYINKLTARFPSIRIIERTEAKSLGFTATAPGVVFVKVGPPLN